jgi:hypothetical protein
MPFCTTGQGSVCPVIVPEAAPARFRLIRSGGRLYGMYKRAASRNVHRLQRPRLLLSTEDEVDAGQDPIQVTVGQPGDMFGQQLAIQSDDL